MQNQDCDIHTPEAPDSRKQNAKIRIVLCVVAAVVVSLVMPCFIQSPLNVLFRDLFNPEGWIVLVPHLRVISTIVCFLMTYSIGLVLLYNAKSKWWLYILHIVCTFSWCVFVAEIVYMVAVD